MMTWKAFIPIYFIVLVRTPTSAAAATTATASPTASAITSASAGTPPATGTTAAGTTAAAAALTRFSLVDGQSRTTDILAVNAGYGSLSLSLIRHLDEAESPGFPGEIVLDYLGGIHISKFLKYFFQLFLGGLGRQITDVDIHNLPLFTKAGCQSR
jgi:hypothetical protein